MVSLSLAFAALAVIAAISPALAQNGTCPGAPLAPGRYEFTITFDGLEREFLVYVPTTASRTAGNPVFLNFHGYLMSMEWQYELTGMPIVAEEGGFIAIVPQGYLRSWSAGACCGAAARDELDDVGYAAPGCNSDVPDWAGGRLGRLTRAIIAYVEALVCVDRDRIFAAGYSNGGYLAFLLGCSASDLIRAIGPFAGALSGEDYFPCNNQTKPVPIMSIHGTDDRLVSYESGEESILEYTQNVIGCVDTPVESFRNNSASCIRWSQCAGGSEAVFCTIEGGFHLWPGCFTTLGCVRATQDINASRELWAFFDRVSRTST